MTLSTINKEAPEAVALSIGLTSPAIRRAVAVIERQAVQNARILLVDDVQDNIDILASLLSLSGFNNVQGTTDPFEVMDLQRTHDFDLILLDIQMPGIDGFEVMRRLKALHPDTYLPVIAVTAHHDYKTRVIAAGARDFIRKPFDYTDIAQRITNAVEVRLLHKMLAAIPVEEQGKAILDPLTGAVTWNAMCASVEKAAQRLNGETGLAAVMWLDLEGIAEIGDKEGVNRVDAILREVSQRLCATVMAGDTVGRMGNHEFAVLLNGLKTMDAVHQCAADVIKAATVPFQFSGESLYVTASLGVSLCAGNSTSAQILSLAATGRLAARAKGKNQYFIACEKNNLAS